MRIYLLAFFLSTFFFCKSQNIIIGRVCDIDSMGISNCHIVSSSGEFTITDSAGAFKIEAKNQDSLYFSHVGFLSKRIGNFDGDKILVILSPKSYMISEVSTYTNVFSRVSPKQEFAIDFCFRSDTLYLLKQINASFQQQELIICKKEDTLYRKKLKDKFKGIAKDKKGTVFCYTKNTIYQLVEYQNDIFLLYPEPYAKFIEMDKKFLGKIEDNLFVMKTELNNSVINYFTYNMLSANYNLIRQINDSVAFYSFEDMVNGALGLNRKKIGTENYINPALIVKSYMYMNSLNKYDISKLYSHIFDDKFHLINLIDNSIEVYSAFGTLFSRINIENSSQLEDNVLIDTYPKSETIYLSKFNKKGHLEIRTLNLQTGKVCLLCVVPDFKYIENVTINNGVLWFLYSDYQTNWTKGLYNVKLMDLVIY